MTAATPRSPGRSSPAIWVLLFMLAAAILAIGFFSQSEDFEVGGFADPNGTGPEGLLAYRLLVEETGGTAELEVVLPDESIDVAVLASPPFPPLFATEGEEFLVSWEPILEWIQGGGTLITSVFVATGPELANDFIEQEFVARGDCDVPSLLGVDEIRVLEYSPIVVVDGDQTCFGENENPVVSIRQIGEGQIIRLATIAPLLNRSLDDADNGAFAARITGLENAPTVALLPEAPVFYVPAEDVEADEIEVGGDGVGNGEQVARDSQGNPIPFDDGDGIPLNDDGDPVGTGTQTLWQLIETRVKVLFAGLVLAGFLLALAAGRRLGSPVIEELPVEIPSASYVDAVGRLYHRTPNSRARSAQILRSDLRSDLARRVGMPAESSALELARAVSGGAEHDELVRALDGPAPASDEEFVALASQIAAIRDSVDRGGVANLARADEISLGQKG